MTGIWIGEGCWVSGVGCWDSDIDRSPNTQHPTPNTSSSELNPLLARALITVIGRESSAVRGIRAFRRAAGIDQGDGFRLIARCRLHLAPRLALHLLHVAADAVAT